MRKLKVEINQNVIEGLSLYGEWSQMNIVSPNRYNETNVCVFLPVLSSAISGLGGDGRAGPV